MSTVPASLRQYRAELVAAIDRELAPRPRGFERDRGERPRLRRSVLLVAAGVAVIAALSLAVVAPWEGSVTLVEQAQAALVAPHEGEILYESVTVRSRKVDFRRSVIRVRVWLDGARPHGFRMTFGGSREAEVGGMLGASTALDYTAADSVLRRRHFPSQVRQSDLDPTAFIKTAMRAGLAKSLGRTTLHGQSVIRFQVGAWFHSASGRLFVPIAVYYADADTFRPVRVVFTPPQEQHPVVAGPLTDAQLRELPPDALVISPGDSDSILRLGLPSLPMDPHFFLVPDASTPVLPPYAVYDFDEYRPLAPTAANRKLTSVRAVHPQAEVR